MVPESRAPSALSSRRPRDVDAAPTTLHSQGTGPERFAGLPAAKQQSQSERRRKVPCLCLCDVSSRAPDSGACAWDSTLSRSNPESKYLLGLTKHSRSLVSRTLPPTLPRPQHRSQHPRKPSARGRANVGRCADGRGTETGGRNRGARSGTRVQPSGRGWEAWCSLPSHSSGPPVSADGPAPESG